MMILEILCVRLTLYMPSTLYTHFLMTISANSLLLPPLLACFLTPLPIKLYCCLRGGYNSDPTSLSEGSNPIMPEPIP